MTAVLALLVPFALTLVSALAQETPPLPDRFAPPAIAPSAAADDIVAELAIEHPGPELFVQEAVLLTLKVTLARPVASLEVSTPSLVNARLLTLDSSRWLANVDGLGSRRFERRIALFPQASGRLEIPPFAVRVTLVDGVGRRYEVVRPTAPASLTVAPLPEGRVRWWLPARSLEIRDGWDPPPDRLRRGEASRRTVVIEAAGLMAEQLPPLPPLRTAGVVTFAHPTELETVIRPDGPVARAVYRWDVRLGIDQPAVLQALTLPWFDTQTREVREAVIPARRIAEASEGRGPAAAARWPAWVVLGGPAALLFALGLALGLVQARDGPIRLDLAARFAELRLVRDLKAAARRNEPGRVRAALRALARHDEERGRGAWRRAPEVAALDRHLFGADGAPPPDLLALTRALLAARRRERAAVSRRPQLAPLDGPQPF